MGNRFKDKVVEEGLEEPRMVARPGQKRKQSEGMEVTSRVDASGDDVKEAEVNVGGDETVVEEQETVTVATETKRGKGPSKLAKVLGGDVLGDKFVLKQIPLILLCLFYLLLIVGNRYRIESLSREKQAADERINELREQRIQMQKQYQQSIKISQIAEDLKGTGVGITSGPPYEISASR